MTEKQRTLIWVALFLAIAAVNLLLAYRAGRIAGELELANRAYEEAIENMRRANEPYEFLLDLPEIDITTIDTDADTP